MTARQEGLGDHWKDLLSSRATVALVAVNLAVFAALFARPDLASVLLLTPTPEAVADRPWTLLTVFFSHEVAVHLLLNMALLLVFAVKLEQVGGRLAMVATYLVSGLAGSLAILLTAPFVWDGELVAGASAAVFGVVTAFATLRPNDIVLKSSAKVWPIALFAVNAALALSSPLARVGAAGHVVGIAVGLACGYVLKRRTDSRAA